MNLFCRGAELLTLVTLAPFAVSGLTSSEIPRKIHWDNIPASALADTPFKVVDSRIREHSREIRGFVSVPLDYSKPSDRQIEIFYRLIPSKGQADNPVLVFMNGGPGVPSSSYRSLAYDYDGSDEDALSELSKYFRILAVDQRGTGNSAPLDLDDPSLSPEVVARFFDSDEHARDHARVIEAVIPEGEKFFILARSYGGEIGFKYLTLEDNFRPPSGIIFSSAVLPHSDALATFLLRRQRQKELNLELRAAHPEVLVKLERLRGHLESIGLEKARVNFLWSYLGKADGWELELDQKVDELLSIETRESMEAELGHDIRQSVNLLNYVLSSAALTGGYTDRTMTQETSWRVPFDDWMLDENWTLTQIGKDGTWREAFIASVDRHPPPPTRFPPVGEIRRVLSETQVLFTFGKTDAFLPQELQLERAQRFHVPGHTAFRVFSGGHGAAFSAEGAAYVREWASSVLKAEPSRFDFVALMNRVAKGWRTKNTELALSAFADDAVYMEPPDLHLFRGHTELRPFFDAVNPGSSMIWHRLWFDEASGIGAGEYTFHNGERATAAHGVAVVEIRNGKIAVWREYQRRGAIDFEDFLRIDGKRWKWTINSLK